MTATPAQLADARAVVWYLGRHPDDFNIILTYARLEATALGIQGAEVCVGCGELRLVSSYRDDEAPLCGRCE